jgi:hypothetical protein
MDKIFTVLNPFPARFSGTPAKGGKAEEIFHSDRAKFLLGRSKIYIRIKKKLYTYKKRFLYVYKFDAVKALIFRVVENRFFRLAGRPFHSEYYSFLLNF